MSTIKNAVLSRTLVLTTKNKRVTIIRSKLNLIGEDLGMNYHEFTQYIKQHFKGWVLLSYSTK